MNILINMFLLFNTQWSYISSNEPYMCLYALVQDEWPHFLRNYQAGSLKLLNQYFKWQNKS